MTETNNSPLIHALDLSIHGPWDEDSPVEKFDAAAQKIAEATNTDPYTGYYLRNIVRGAQPMTERVGRVCTNFLDYRLARKDQQPASPSAEKKSVNAPSGVKIVEDSIVLTDSKLCTCGVWFVPVVPNQKYHAKACRRRERNRRRREKRAHKS